MVGRQVKINTIGILVMEFFAIVSIRKKRLSKSKEAGEIKNDRISRNIFMELEKR